MKTSLRAALWALTVLGSAAGQRPTPMSVSVYLGSDGAANDGSDAAKRAIEKFVAGGFESRGIHRITDNGLNPRDSSFDDSGWVVIKSIGDSGSKSYALDVQLSIVQGASVNYMLLRFRGSLASAVLVRDGAARQEINATFDKVLFGVLDKLMDEAKREFGTPTYRHGWHPVPVPHPAN